MKKKKKICIVSQFPPPVSGLTKAVETLYNSYLKQEFDFEMIDIKNNKKILFTILKLFKSDADLFYFTISQSKWGNWRDLLIMKLLNIRKKKCLIHLHGGYYRTLIEKYCGKLQKKLNYSAIKRLNGVIVLSDGLKNAFNGMIDGNKIFIVPNCVEDKFLISKEDLKIKLDTISNKNVFNVLYLSNFIESKGYKEVLHLAKITKDNNIRNLQFKFAGKFFDEKEKKFFDSYVKENQLEELVQYKGAVYGQDKIKLLNECDIFILLSRNEGQPISILEAMGNGMVIISTDEGGIPDIVRNEKNGFIFNKNIKDIKVVMESIAYLTENTEVLKRIANQNYIDVISKYKENVYINNMEKLFRNI